MNQEDFSRECERRLEDFQRKLDRMAEDAERDLIKKLITNHGKTVYLTVYQAAGILNWSTQTVMKHLRHIDSTDGGGSNRFLLSDIEEMMEENVVEKSKGGSR
jgi:hypothetical protein